MNRVGMESRALQLAMMGIKNILALTGDYSGRGFGGQGAPVFDIDSVQLQILLGMLNERLQASGDPEPFFSGFAVSPFKTTEAELFAQYAKLCRKASAGAKFAITQLGYDVRSVWRAHQNDAPSMLGFACAGLGLCADPGCRPDYKCRESAGGLCIRWVVAPR
jgi:5,10-methylenetetrahydrofolate reductase